MHDKDVISKHLLKRLAVDMARILLSLDLDEVDVIETQQQRVEERRADLVVKARAGDERFLLHIEIQNHNETAMPWRMLRYRTDIRLEQPLLPIRQYLLYIGKKPLTMADGITETGLNYRYRLIDMHGVDAEALLRQDTPEALVIAILADFKDHPERQMVHKILRRLTELTADNQAAFREYLLMLEILSTNRDPQALIQQEEAMISQIKYTDLPSYGLGKQEGKQEGKLEGKQEGKQEGRLEGIQQGEALMLLRLLELKFGTVPSAARERLQALDANDLLACLDRALTAQTLDEVLRQPQRGD